jgi:hypothetical protein
MGKASLGLTVVGLGTMIAHYIVSSLALAKAVVIVLGVVTTLALLAAHILGTLGMRKQSETGSIRTDMFNPALLGHGMSGTLLVVGLIMCVIANIMKF